MDFTKQMDIGSILGYSFRLFKRHIWAFLLVGLFLNTPAMFISNPDFSTDMLTQGVGLYVVLYLAFIIYSLVGKIFLIFMVDDFISKNNFIVEKTLSKSFSRFWSLLLTAILMMVLLSILYVLLVIPGIIFTVFWMFTGFGVVLRGYSGMKALRYSKHLVRNRWWQTFGYLILIIIVAVVSVFVLNIPLFLLIPDYMNMAASGAFFANPIYMIYSVIVNSLLLYFSVVMQVFFMNYEGTVKKRQVLDAKPVIVEQKKAVKSVSDGKLKAVKVTKAKVTKANKTKATATKKKSSK